MARTILIMAGGTGGHVFPGLAVADELRGRGWNVVWMGSRGGMEARLVPARGYSMACIRAVALRGRGLAAKLLLPLNLLVGFWQSARAIFRIRPDVVLGMGGYVAFPGGMMASLLARPLVVHEQNAIAGLANRVLGGVADRVLVAFPEAMKNGEWTGNPVRAEIAALADPVARYGSRSGPLRLLVVGGSLGAQALNERCRGRSRRWRPRSVPASSTSRARSTLRPCVPATPPPGSRASCSPSSMTWPRATRRPTWSSAAPGP